MNSARSRGRILLGSILITVVLLVSGCSALGLGVKEPIEVEGTWTWESASSDYTERWTITDDSIVKESAADGTTFSTIYEANIISYYNGGLNAGDTSLTAGGDPTIDAGFAVIEYTEVNNAGTGEVGKYNVFRWDENATDSDARDFVTGYKNVGEEFPDNVNGVFDEPNAAHHGATNENGYFQFASRGATLAD